MLHAAPLSALLGLSVLLGTVEAVNPNPDLKPPIYAPKHTSLLPIHDSVYGVRNVSYWVTDDGLAVIDGDVIYGPVQDLLARGLNGHSQESIARRAHSIQPSANIWPSATVLYKFDSAATEQTLSSVVNGAIANWKATAPYLTFTKVANSAVGQNGVTMIKAPSCGGCNSAIGYANAPLNMNLQQTCTPPNGVCGVAEATHEFGHLLGLFHEHQRVDREKYVHYNCANLDPTCTTMPAGKTCCDSGLPSGCCGNAGNFNILSGPTFDASGPYDVKSIMHYRADGFAKPGTDVLTAVAPGLVVPVSNPTAIDSIDSDRVCKLYANLCPKAKACKAAGCPTDCDEKPQCNKPSLCDNPKTAPPCCFGTTSAACTRAKATCTAKGCDFLI